MSELKPCPFCGKQPLSRYCGNNVPGMDDCGYWGIDCCHAFAHADTEDEAAEQWNSRAAQITPQAGEAEPVAREDVEAAILSGWTRATQENGGLWAAIADEIMKLIHPSNAEPIATVVDNNQPGWTAIIETAPNVTLDVGTKLYRTAPPRPVAPAKTLDQWHEDFGPVVWFCWDAEQKRWLGEPAWIGTPNDDSWPEYHTHWVPHPEMPSPPDSPGAEEL